MNKEQVRAVVRETIAELLRTGVLAKYDSSAAYTEVVARLRDFYANGETDAEIKQALQSIDGDPYARLIPLYFSYQYTNEKLAAYYNVEVSTISRNKRRLCLLIYDALR